MNNGEDAQAILDDLYSRHALVALPFSGGKDSTSCLELVRPYWNRTVVIWANTGDAFPETVRLMAAIRKVVPRFVEAKGNLPQAIEQNGIPSEIVPMTNSPWLHAVVSDAELPKIQSWYSCCTENLYLPLHGAILESGATAIVRGDRAAEKVSMPERFHRQSPLGYEMCFPLQHWSEDDSFEFLKTRGIPVLSSYSEIKTSLDCLHCPALIGRTGGTLYRDTDGTDYLRWLAGKHPQAAKKVLESIKAVHRVCAQRTEELGKVANMTIEVD